MHFQNLENYEVCFIPVSILHDSSAYFPLIVLAHLLCILFAVYLFSNRCIRCSQMIYIISLKRQNHVQLRILIYFAGYFPCQTVRFQTDKDRKLGWSNADWSPKSKNSSLYDNAYSEQLTAVEANF